MEKTVRTEMQETEQKALIIGEHTAQKKADEQLKERKEALYNEALKYCERVIQINDVDSFKSSFSTYLRTQFKIEHPEMFPNELVSVDTALNLVQFDIQKLYLIEKDYKSIHVPEQVDYFYYLNDPEGIARYNQLLNVCREVNKIRELQHVEIGLLLQSFGGTLSWSWDENKLEPNLSYFISNYR